jgi:RND superfamily putative drug exporter
LSELLAKLARTLSHRWKRSLALAVLTVIALGAAVGAAPAPPPDDFEVPGAESQRAYDLLNAHTPALAGADATVVFYVEDGTLSDAERKAAIEGALEEIRALDGVAVVTDPFEEKPPRISQDGRIAASDVRYTLAPEDVEPEHGEALEEAARTAEQGGVEVALRGIVVDIAGEQEAPVGELIGVAIAIVLLTLLFRSAASMGATLVGALLGVMVGQMLIAALSRPLGLPEFAGVLAVMLGLGAGIDYALLIIGRFREQMAAGDSLRDAAAKAAATAGSAVVTAGLIVMVAIAGLLVIGIPLIGKLGIGAAIGVGAVVLSAITILPIMIGALGRWLRPKKAAHVRHSAAFERWGEAITRHPWRAIVAGVAVLLVFAIPVLDMRLGLPDDGNQPESKTQRIAYDKLSEAFGPGSNGPFLLVAEPSRGELPQAELTALTERLSAVDGVAAVSPPQPSEDGAIATIFLVPETSPEDKATSDLLAELREDVIPQATQGSGLEVYIGGNTATFEDFSDKVASRLPVFIALVIGLSVLLLIAAFRSLWIPLVSAVFNLLSVAAAYGVVTAVFQDGIGASLIGADSNVPIVSFVPVMLFAILFGLSMDYNVFLLSRVHEAYNEGDSPRDSVIHGVSRIGKVVLFAGLIMASVFLAFVTQPDIISKMMGLGLGLAILIDVLLVRLVIAPAVVTLLGDRAWRVPGWLDRVLPRVSLEGHLVENVDPRGEPLDPEFAAPSLRGNNSGPRGVGADGRPAAEAERARK